MTPLTVGDLRLHLIGLPDGTTVWVEHRGHVTPVTYARHPDGRLELVADVDGQP